MIPFGSRVHTAYSEPIEGGEVVFDNKYRPKRARGATKASCRRVREYCRRVDEGNVVPFGARAWRAGSSLTRSASIFEAARRLLMVSSDLMVRRITQDSDAEGNFDPIIAYLIHTTRIGVNDSLALSAQPAKQSG